MTDTDDLESFILRLEEEIRAGSTVAQAVKTVVTDCANVIRKRQFEERMEEAELRRRQENYRKQLTPSTIKFQG